jgi:pimeloyl-ACP methyl ester carboxylesterase
MTDPIMKRGKGDGIKLQLAEWGSGEKTVLCIHGMTANCRCWERMVPALARDRRVLGVDLRGRGLSEKPATGYSLDHHIRDIRFLLEDQALKRVTLLGHSLGAYISVMFSALFPEKVDRLILLDGGGQLSQQRWDRIEQVIKPSLDRLEQVFPSFAAYTEPLKKAPIFQPWSEFHETYFHYDVKRVDRGIRSRIDPGHIRKEISDIRKKSIADYYKNLACDVLILRATNGILGDDDLLLPEQVVEKMLKTIPSSKSMAVEGTNHFSILFNQHDERDKAIGSFIEALPAHLPPDLASY